MMWLNFLISLLTLSVLLRSYKVMSATMDDQVVEKKTGEKNVNFYVYFFFNGINIKRESKLVLDCQKNKEKGERKKQMLGS